MQLPELTQKNEERIPFNLRELERMIGREFYVAIASCEARKKNSLRLEREGASKEVVAEVRDIAGIIGEMQSREPHKCLFYELEYLPYISFEDGTPVGNIIARKGSFSQYIFTLKSVESNTNNVVVLHGSARVYKHCTNSLGNVEEIMKLSFPKQPRGYKIKSGIKCPGS